ncbi:MAG: AAA family ATPase [Desulfobacteraceae bacterium]|nr:AAA family ATPase [Desulfobacteraceae bacterium]
MQVKSYKAPTIAQALDLVKKELGPDAIILGNKQITVSPNESYVEVTAAAEPESFEAPANNRFPGGEGKIEEDIQEIKSFLSLLVSSKDYFSQLQSQQPLAEIYHGLLMRGLDERHAFLLLNKAVSQMEGPHASKQQIIETFSRLFLERIKLSRPFQNIVPSNDTSPCFVFLGPTGVGKTTSLAKLAAYLKIKRQLEVGIISIDTYRIGAVDQLQTYASILDIPLIVAQSKAELNHARDQFRHHDVVLVDTTGKNFLHKKHVQDISQLFSERDNTHHFLVLGATGKDDDLKQTILHFRNIEIHSLIFTKVDETINHGSIVNQLLRFPFPVSYLGTGQRVPEDIELATHKRILSFLFPVRK